MRLRGRETETEGGRERGNVSLKGGGRAATVPFSSDRSAEKCKYSVREKERQIVREKKIVRERQNLRRRQWRGRKAAARWGLSDREAARCGTSRERKREGRVRDAEMGGGGSRVADDINGSDDHVTVSKLPTA